VVIIFSNFIERSLRIKCANVADLTRLRAGVEFFFGKGAIYRKITADMVLPTGCKMRSLLLA
jgi:hypothetical protein